MYILNICEKLDCYDYRIYIGEGETFRERTLLPEGRRYKQNREGLVRSLFLDKVKSYLVTYHDAEIIRDIEVDDYLAMLGYQNYKRNLTSGEPSTADMDIVIARDKDAMGCDGWLYNPDKKDKPIYINGFGKIWLDDKGKLRGIGRKFKYFQILFGDSVDHYAAKVTPNKTFVYGEKSIFKVLDPLTTDKECWELIVSKYKEWIPEEVTYTAWNGSKETDNWLTWLQKHFTLVHMLRFEGDNPQVVDILNKLRVEI